MYRRFPTLRGLIIAVLLVVLCCICSITSRCQEVYTWGKSFQVLDLTGQKSIQVNQEYHINIDFNRNLVKVNLNDKGYSEDNISKVIKYPKEGTAKVVLESGVFLLLEKRGIAIVDPEIKNTFYFFQIGTSNYLIKD